MSVQDDKPKIERAHTLPRKCPCGATIGFTVDAEGVVSGGLTHTLPMCKPFLELGPVEYLRYVRGAQ